MSIRLHTTPQFEEELENLLNKTNFKLKPQGVYKTEFNIIFIITFFLFLQRKPGNGVNSIRNS